MPFNSNTYHTNKHRRAAWRYLTQAREIKARVKAGEAYAWEEKQITSNIMLARLEMRMVLTGKRLAALDKKKK